MKIREINLNDAKRMLELNIKLDSDSEFMLFEQNERPKNLDVQTQVIERLLSEGNITWLVAESADGELHGYCVIASQPQNRVQHVGSAVIGVEKSHHSKGIGFKLISSAIQHSESRGVRRIELTVRTDNSAAISLYKKTGFVIEGERRESLRIKGRFYNELYMAKV